VMWVGWNAGDVKRNIELFKARQTRVNINLHVPCSY
jgi:hypothetical protein